MSKTIDSLLSELLIEKGLVNRKDLEPILKEAASSGQGLQQVLIKRAIVAEKDIVNLLAGALKVNFINPKDLAIDKAVTGKVPLKVASYYRFMPITLKDRVLTIAVSAPLDIKTQDEIRMQLGYDIEINLACEKDIAEALMKYYGIAAETLGSIVSQTAGGIAGMSQEGTQVKVDDLEKLAEDASVIKLVNQIILEAWRKRATDIHIEPYRTGVALRYRIDGILYDTPVPAEFKNFINAVISRIKIMSNLNIVERRLPQDGRAVVRVQEQVLDLRISTIPTPFGESVVIRILPTQMLFNLEKLGLSKRNLQIFERLIQKPHGIIFVTGPTGSGKTTTLYTSLSRINTKERKIITIEDPIEYEMPGITQIQVLPEIGLDFARGLRSILRHDPDVIMVGEVRDVETAETAIRVALTGHLVFSTVHTNDAASGVTRLLDIGLEPYLVASSVEAFIAQRLIRVICQDCKYEDKSAPTELKTLISADLKIKAADVKIFRGKGCASCNFTGFWGRTAIYEILLIDEPIKSLILKKASAAQIKNIAVSRGMQTLRQDGWQKAILGITTPEEVIRVTSAEELASPAQGAIAAFSAARDEGARSANEKRVYERLHSKVNLRYTIIKSQDELVKRGVSPEQFSITRNISAGGLLFIAEEPLMAGSFLEMKMELPDGGPPVECLAKVVRVDEIEGGRAYDIAICYLDITGSERSRLNNYIDTESRG